jgi:dihydrofolate reductase
MRKLKLQMNGPDFKWDDEVRRFCIENLKNVDCILLGRTTAEGFIPYWAQVSSNPRDPEFKLGKRLTDIPKMVFSKKLKKLKWDNATLAKAGIVEEINKLKKQKGKKLIVYGGHSFVSSLIRQGLIDEYYLLVNPLAVGGRQPIFKILNNSSRLTLKKCKPFPCGTILLCYAGKK